MLTNGRRTWRLIGAIVAVSLAPLHAHAAAVVVENVAELQAAIADQPPNTTIKLKPGVYDLTDHVYLKRGMDLVGIPPSRRHPATIRQSILAQFHAFDGGDITIKNLRLQPLGGFPLSFNSEKPLRLNILKCLFDGSYGDQTGVAVANLDEPTVRPPKIKVHDSHFLYGAGLSVTHLDSAVGFSSLEVLRSHFSIHPTETWGGIHVVRTNGRIRDNVFLGRAGTAGFGFNAAFPSNADLSGNVCVDAVGC